MAPAPTAFVAMKFDDLPWRDKRYTVISEVLREAGFQVVRADEIRSSEVSVTDVTQLLRESDLVVADLSGNSNNVSYELGYCHGCGRSPATLILLCRTGDDLPFSYAHFRHYGYKDLRDLRAVLRYRLQLSTPLTDEQTGYVVVFKTGTGIYGAEVAEAILDSLEALTFTGRCEYYAGNTLPTDPRQYVVGLGIRHTDRKKRSDYAWFNRLKKLIDTKLKSQEAETILEFDEITMMRGIRHDLLPRGVAEFEGGSVRRLLNPEELDSWFSSAAHERTAVAQEAAALDTGEEAE